MIVYTPEHDGTLAQRSVDEIEELMYVLARPLPGAGPARTTSRYVYIFENKGERSGSRCTIRTASSTPSRSFRPGRSGNWTQRGAPAKTGPLPLCDIVETERQDGRRMVLESEHFYAAVPFYARWPYEVHIWAAAHRASCGALSRARSATWPAS